MAKQYWLMKSEPYVYSIDDLERDGSTCWEGVRNYKARNNMRSMKAGDEVLYYHSNAKPPGVVGIARVCKEAYPDYYAFDEKSDYFDPKSSPDNPRYGRCRVRLENQQCRGTAWALRDQGGREAGRHGAHPVRASFGAVGEEVGV